MINQLSNNKKLDSPAADNDRHLQQPNLNNDNSQYLEIARISGLAEHTNCMVSNNQPSKITGSSIVYLGSQKHTKLQKDGSIRTIEGQLFIYDLGEPASPVLLSSIRLDIKDMQLAGQWLITASVSGLISILDISDPFEPAIVLEHQYSARINKLLLESTDNIEQVPTLFVQSFDRGYSQIDLFALPNNLRVGENIKISNHASAMTSLNYWNATSGREKRYFCYAEAQRLRIALVNAKTQKFEIQAHLEIMFGSHISALASSDNKILVGTRDGRLRSFSFTDENGLNGFESPNRSNNDIRLNSPITSIVVNGAIASVVTLDGVNLIDISNAKQLVKRQSIVSESPVVNVNVVNDLLLVKDLKGLSLYQIPLT